MSNISFNAIHYIFLETTKSKAKDSKHKLKNAVRSFHKKFNGVNNCFLTIKDTSASVEELWNAYIEYGVEAFMEAQRPEKFKDGISEEKRRNLALSFICNERSIPEDELKLRLLAQSK